MAELQKLLLGVDVICIVGNQDAEVVDVVFDSRKAAEKHLFVAVKGTQHDGHFYMSEVADKGVSVIVCQVLPDDIKESVCYVLVNNSAKALGIICSNYFNNPSRRVRLVGVTGTNGKTSFVTLCYQLFNKLGHNCGMISTVENRIGDRVMPSTHTTPDAYSINSLLRSMADEGCSHVFMEVSSHALDQHRTAGLVFALAVFTNITHDHLDYHKTFAAYISAKKLLFDGLSKSAFALINKDDRNATVMTQNSLASVKTFALKSPADFKCRILENSITGLHLVVDGEEIFSFLVGEFNAYNLTAVYAAAIILGEDKHECLTALSALTPPEGRFDIVMSKEQKIVGVVDYAHTPDALKNVMHTINATRNGAGKLIAVVGCGGDRDKSKRPVMAEVAARLSAKAIFTSDNPRSEKPEIIIEEMMTGVSAAERKKVLSIIDRREAIRTACMLSESGDVILLAGKGHEKYQEVNGVKSPFDDKQVLSEVFEEMGK